VLTALEAEAVLRIPDVDDVLGLRDRAMLEVLYSTAVRRAELVSLRIYDLDRARGTLMVREGKGKRDRVVPMGERALLWVDKYLGESRPELVAAIDDGALFLANTGEALSLDHVSMLVRQYVDRADLGKRGACHLFRHTAATLMLENGADIRFIQQLLGHAKLDTTAIYTQVSIHKLKEVHALTHPGARLSPRLSVVGCQLSEQNDSADPPTTNHDPTTVLSSLAAQSDRVANATAEELHAAPQAEADEEVEDPASDNRELTTENHR
jgi:integrase/recombinase XerD